MIDRTVQQAGFFVLYKVAMPSILIELGFISNTEEEKYLVREDTQELLAVCIYNAFVEYKNMLEGTLKPYLPVPRNPKLQPVLEYQDISEVNDPQIVKEPEIEPENSDTIAPLLPVQPEPVKEVVSFRIQFFISKDNLNTSDKKFSSVPEVKKYHENNTWKYTSGDFKTQDAAQNKLKEVKKYFPDAFIIAFRNDKRISIQEAQELLK
jgi:N-acetylmuramoyl-L-alanine amidase